MRGSRWVVGDQSGLYDRLCEIWSMGLAQLAVRSTSLGSN